MKGGACSARGASFTLVELLAVIAIAAILAALVLPAYDKVRIQASSAQSTSNLRQIGMAIASYGNDYESSLPGPLWNVQGGCSYVGGQTVSYVAELPAQANGNLIVLLGPYLGGTTAPGHTEYTKAWMYPAFTPYVSRGSAVDTYYATPGVTNSSGIILIPWGYPSSSAPSMRLPALSAAGFSLAQTWAVAECDQQLVASVAYTSAAWYSSIPPKTVHGNGIFRNALFFDGHVGRLDARGAPLP